MDSWERLIDKDEQRNYDFFVTREYFQKKAEIKEEEEK